MAFSVTCPYCRAILKSANPVGAGKTVRCAKCGQAFETLALEDSTAVSASPPGLAPLTLDDRPASAPEEAPAVGSKKRRDDRDDEPRRRRDREEDYDDEPRSKRDRDEGEPRIRKPKRRTSNFLGISIGLGILTLGVLAVGCVGCGGLGYWMYTVFGRHPIVGRWEQTNHPLGQKVINSFDPDGKGSVQLANITIAFKYRVEGNNLTIEPQQAVQGPLGGVTERFSMQINGDNMTLTRTDNLANMPFAVRELHFRRMR